QDKYVTEILRKFRLQEGKSASTPIDTEMPLLKDPNGEDVDVHTYRLISWQCKKQTVVAISFTEPEYVAAASCCAQVLWIHNQLQDYGEGFNQIIDFLNGISIKYALTVNPNIYVSCIKQFWTTIVVKQVNGVTRLQALVDKKKVVVTEATIRKALHLYDEEGIEYLPNEEIFTELARMGYEKPSTKLTFYKAFFSSQWKSLIHTILQCMSAKRTSWNEFSSSMASAVICFSSGRKFNFSKYIFDSLRVGKGFSRVETPLFESMLVEQQVDKEGDADENVKEVNASDAAEGDVSDARGEVPTFAEEPSIPSPTPPSQPSQDIPLTSQVQPTPPQSPQLKRRVKKLERRNKVRVLKLRRLQRVRTAQRVETSDETVLDDVVDEAKEVADVVKDVEESSQDQGRTEESQVEIYKIDLDHANKVLSMHETITAASTNIIAAEAHVPAVTLTVAPTRVAATPSRRGKGVVIRDPEEESTTSTIIPAETKSKDKGKGILVEEPKPLKKKQPIKQDEQYARELQAELNKNID
nr:ribonuclease H-like domain, reverse transcriptase, RNA-dependent DNA polymerase [Tanacetum cinerariifolium]